MKLIQQSALELTKDYFNNIFLHSFLKTLLYDSFMSCSIGAYTKDFYKMVINTRILYSGWLTQCMKKKSRKKVIHVLTILAEHVTGNEVL